MKDFIKFIGWPKFIIIAISIGFPLISLCVYLVIYPDNPNFWNWVAAVQGICLTLLLIDSIIKRIKKKWPESNILRRTKTR